MINLITFLVFMEALENQACVKELDMRFHRNLCFVTFKKLMYKQAF